jgi:hypothetical protein
VEAYPNYYSTGDIYFSTLRFSMDPFVRYIHPNSTTKMFLQATPSYFFERMYLGRSTPLNLVKEFSTFVQYETIGSGGPQIVPGSENGNWIWSQNSNAFTSNYFNLPLKLEMAAATVMSNYLRDGPGGFYTLYHRIPGAMANLIDDGYCGYLIGDRGGFSNPALTYDNRSAATNSAFVEVYNQHGAAPPMPGP